MPRPCPSSARSPTLPSVPTRLPGSVPQPSQQEIQQYFAAHQAEYTIPEQARSRHILIKVAPGADAKTDAAAKAKAEGLLKQIQGGANFAELAKANSDDPGSKDKGGELGFAKPGTMVPEFDNAIFTQKIGDTKIVKTPVRLSHHPGGGAAAGAPPAAQRGRAHHPGHAGPPEAAAAEENYAQTLTSEAIKNGLEKTAAAHHLQVATTPLVGAQGVIAALGRLLQDPRQGLPVPAGRSAAVRLHRRGLRDLPGHRCRSGPRAQLCRLEEPRSGRLSQ